MQGNSASSYSLNIPHILYVIKKELEIKQTSEATVGSNERNEGLPLVKSTFHQHIRRMDTDRHSNYCTRRRVL